MELEVGKHYKTRGGRKAEWRFSGKVKLYPIEVRLEGDNDDEWEAYSESGFYWGEIDPHENDLISVWAEPTTGTLAELGVKPGDVVELVYTDLSVGYIGMQATIMDGMNAVFHDGGNLKSGSDDAFSRRWRIVSRAPKAFKTESILSDYDRAVALGVLTEPTGPVITETITRKRIVPGVYGKVKVNHHAGDMVQLQFQGSNLTSSVKFTRAELIAARDILSQLIDAMPDK